MEYKLAKELKDNRFPQNPNKHNEAPNSWVCEDDTLADFEGACGGEKEAYVPTLSELTEACGEEREVRGDKAYFSLQRDEHGKDVWLAGYNEYMPYEGNYLHHSTEGSTPKIAVAKLWLKLNK